MNTKRIVVIGATSSIAEHCSRIWAKQSPSDFFLVGRDLSKLESLAADLQVRNPMTSIQTFVTNFTDPPQIEKCIDQIFSDKTVDIVLIAHGLLPDQSECQQDLTKIHESFLINCISPVLFAEAIARRMQCANTGTLAIIGSVAGDRGRKTNYVYGSAKGAIERYTQGLQHRLHDTNVNVVLIKPGPTDTPMTAHLRQDNSRLAAVDDVARAIVRGIERKQAVLYAPKKWSAIMMAIRHIPSSLFNRLDI